MDVKITHENGISEIKVSGSITSSNSAEFGTALDAEPGDSTGVELDFKDLEFVSSAGLRVLLALKKKCGAKPFSILNCNDTVKNIFDVTGFSEIMDVRRAPREISVEGCDLIGAGACGECFRLDEETIIKLYYDRISKAEIEREKQLAKQAFVMGVPTAISYDIVTSKGRLGVVYEMIKSRTLGELVRNDPDNVDKYTDIYVDVCKSIHEIVDEGHVLPSFKDINRADIPNVSGISEEERALLYKFIDLVPDGDTCVHGDLNLNNIMVENGKGLLIDMGEFSRGIPAFDMSRLVFSFHFAAEPGDYNPFYKMPRSLVEKAYGDMFRKYYGTDDYTKPTKEHPDAGWIMPLAWFRSVTSMLKGTHWSEEKRTLAKTLLREKLIPFIEVKSI